MAGGRGETPSKCDALNIARRRSQMRTLPLVLGVMMMTIASVLLHLHHLHLLGGLSLSPTGPSVKTTPLLPKHLPVVTLRLNCNKPITCPRVLMLRTPKTASSSLASLFFLRRSAAGGKCSNTYFPTGRYLPRGTYTLNATMLSTVPSKVLLKHSAFIAHMNYTPELRHALNTSRLYRLTSLRDARARAESLFAYEVHRPHVELRPALEYLGAPRLSPAVDTSDELSPSLPGTSIRRQIDAAVRHWHLIMIAEYWDESLAVLMHSLEWRLVDVLAPPLNVQDPIAKRKALATSHAYRIDHPEDEARFWWTIDVDNQLYRRAVNDLERKFRSLPSEFRNVPVALRQLRGLLMKACPTSSQQKHFSREDMQCLRKFRRSLLHASGVKGWAR